MRSGEKDPERVSALRRDKEEAAMLELALEATDTLSVDMERLETFRTDFDTALTQPAKDAIEAQEAVLLAFIGHLEGVLGRDAQGVPFLASAYSLIMIAQEVADTVQPPTASMSDLITGLDAALEWATVTPQRNALRALLGEMLALTQQHADSGGESVRWVDHVAVPVALQACYAFARADTSWHARHQQLVALRWATRALVEA